ncbi:uncharacterized protein JCM6883_000671 [Sporobolomyces salmoneus]|uniref:uncharacterized protein n=1 Tax=Sporobolomyces salmoneus TaxID=183962 RepID=UPI003181BBB7
MSRPASCHYCLASSSTCDHQLPCSACISTSRTCTYDSPTLSHEWSTLPRSQIQQWFEHPKLSRGSLGGGRLKPVRNERGEIDQFEWENLVAQNQDLRLKPLRKRARRLLKPSVNLENESEYLDLIGDPVPFSNDAHLLSGLYSVLPDLPIHPTILLNTHIAAYPPPTKSRIALEAEPSDLNRGNCVASTSILSEGGGGEAIVWRMGDERFKRPTAVGWGIFKSTRRKASSKGKERAVDQDAMDIEGTEQEEGQGGGPFRACPRPIFTHHAPIQQLELLSLPSSSDSTMNPNFLLGARSLTSLDLINLALPTPFDPGKSQPPSILSHESFSIPRSTIADFSLGGICQGYGQAGQGLIVDIRGNLFGFGLSTTNRELFQLRKGFKRNEREYSGFARVQYGAGGVTNDNLLQTEAIVGVEDQVLLYDLRSPTSQLELLGPDTLSRYLPYGVTQLALVTSLLSRSPATSTSPWLHTICTTRDILWLDRRMAGEGGSGGEVLRWEHERVGIEGKGIDRSLSMTELPSATSSEATEGSQVQRIALSSRVNSQISIFTTGLEPTKAPKSLLDPYDLPSPYSGDVQVEGKRFRRVGLSISARYDDDEEEDGAQEDNEMDEEGISEEAKRRKRFLRRMVKEAEADERRKRKGKKLSLFEVGMDGELFERDVGLAKNVEEDEPQSEEQVSEEVTRGEEVQGDRNFETLLLDMRAIKAAISPEEVVGDEPHGSTDGAASVGLLKRTVEQAREIEGDVGALTALELFDLGHSAEPAPTPASDRDSEEEEEMQDAQTEPRRSKAPSTIESLPRPSAFVASREIPLLSTSLSNRFPLLESLVSTFSTSAASTLNPFSAPISSRFHTFSPFPFSLQQGQIAERADSLRKTFNIPESDSPCSLACDRVAADLSLSSQMYLPRSIEPDEPTDTPNQPQPANEEPPPLHLSYLRPIVSDRIDEDSDDDSDGGRGVPSSFNRRRKKKPTLNGRGARLLLAEWHIGSDPRSYVWTNPYEGEKEKDDPYSQFSQPQSRSQRKKASRSQKKRGNGAGDDLFSSSQSQIPSFSQSRFDFPSSFPQPPSSASQAYFPSLGAPPTLNVVSEDGGGGGGGGAASSSQDRSQWNVAQTQPTISVSGPPSSSQPGFFGGGTNSQVVPGAFGSRIGFGKMKEKEKKKTKKRVSGF